MTAALRVAAMPACMAAFNALSLAEGILCQGRLKEGAARFAVLYALAVIPAWRGDPGPFLTVLSMPG